jgi:hypothetical protein
VREGTSGCDERVRIGGILLSWGLLKGRGISVVSEGWKGRGTCSLLRPEVAAYLY